MTLHGSASVFAFEFEFETIERHLYSSYQPAQCPEAARQYTVALVWCRDRLEYYQRFKALAPLACALSLLDWATLYAPERVLALADRSA